MSGFNFDEKIGYSVVRFESELLDMAWGDVEEEASAVVEQIKSTETARLVIDLMPMNLIQSGLVASLVRMWKATDGWPDRKVVVATDNEVVNDVMRSAGLLNLLTVVESLEEASSGFKTSTKAATAIRQGRVFAWAAFPLALFSAVALFPVFYMDSELLQTAARTTAMLAAGIACIAAVLSTVKDDGYRRAFGILSMLIGLTVLGILNAQRTLDKSGVDQKAAAILPAPQSAKPEATDSDTE